jgi:hypothetical protein
MLQMLTEMIGSEELLRLIAFSKFVNMVQVLGANVPLRGIWEFFSTITTNVCAAGRRRRMESGFYASKGRTGP